MKIHSIIEHEVLWRGGGGEGDMLKIWGPEQSHIRVII